MAGRQRAAAAGRLLGAGLPAPPCAPDGGRGLPRGQVGAAGSAGCCPRGGVAEGCVREGSPPSCRRQQEPAGNRLLAFSRARGSCSVPLCARARGLAAAGLRAGNAAPLPAAGCRLAAARGALEAARRFPPLFPGAFEAGRFSPRVGLEVKARLQGRSGGVPGQRC